MKDDFKAFFAAVAMVWVTLAIVTVGIAPFWLLLWLFTK